MHVDTVRKVFGEVEVDGTDLGRRDLQGAVGEDREVHVEDGQDVREDVGDDHVRDEDPEGEGGQRQVETSETERRQGDEPADDGGDHHPQDDAPHRDALGRTRARRARGGRR